MRNNLNGESTIKHPPTAGLVEFVYTGLYDFLSGRAFVGGLFSGAIVHTRGPLQSTVP